MDNPIPDPHFTDFSSFIQDEASWFPTSWYFKHETAYITETQIPSKLDIDPRTLFRIKLHISLLYPEYNVSWTFLEEDLYSRLHLCIESLDVDFTFVESRLTELINPTGIDKLYPLVDLKILNNNWILDIMPDVSVTHLTYENNIAYVDLDQFTDINNYVIIYEMFSRYYNLLIQSIGKKGMIYTMDESFIQNWKLKTPTQLDFPGFEKLPLPQNLNDWISDPKYNIEIKIKFSEGLHIPIDNRGYKFYKDRAKGKPYYFTIGPNPVVWHFVALKFPDIWIIDGVIEISLLNYADLNQIEIVKECIINAEGNVVIDEILVNPINEAKYFLGPERRPITSYLV